MAIKGYIKRLENLHTDFKGYHFSDISLVEEGKKVLSKEQAKLDDHEGRVTDLTSHLLGIRKGEGK